MSNRYKVGDYVLYDDKTYWKVYKVVEVINNYYKYKCLDSSYTGTIINGYFTKGSLVATKGEVVSKDDVTAFILAKRL